jgi:hypothetical protein
MSAPERDNTPLLAGHAAVDEEEGLVMAGQPERAQQRHRPRRNASYRTPSKTRARAWAPPFDLSYARRRS